MQLGERYGRLTVLRTGLRRGKNAAVVCHCVCGARTIALAATQNNLFEGTNADNVADRVRKGRSARGKKTKYAYPV